MTEKHITAAELRRMNSVACIEAANALDAQAEQIAALEGALEICMEREEAVLRLLDPKEERAAEMLAIREQFSTSQPLRERLASAKARCERMEKAMRLARKHLLNAIHEIMCEEDHDDCPGVKDSAIVAIDAALAPETDEASVRSSPSAASNKHENDANG